MLTTWMLNQPDMLGQAAPDGNPIAAISDVGQTQVGQNISLDAKASFDPTHGSNALSYTWSFGDGTTASGISVNHTYNAVGTYTLKLTVTSPVGKRSITKILNVGTKPNIYDNPYSPLPGKNNLNPAVMLPVANNSLPVQPMLPPLPTPTPAVTPPPPTTIPVIATPTHSPTISPSAPSSVNDILLVLIGIGIVIIIIGGLVYIILRILRSP
jgi:PKD repeat protein